MIVQVASEHAVPVAQALREIGRRRLQQNLRAVDRAGGDDHRAARHTVGGTALHVAHEHRLDALASPDHSSCVTSDPCRTVNRPERSAGLIMRTNELKTVPLSVRVVSAP